MAAARPRARRWQARSPPQEQTNAQRDQDDGDDRPGQLDLLDALDQDGDERAQRRDADEPIKEGRDDVER